MEQKYIGLHLVVDRYLQGTLSVGEVAEFEERLVWDHELIDELDLAERLRDGLRAADRKGRYTVTAGRAGIGDWLSDLFSVPQYAAAGSFALAVALTAGVLLNPFSAGLSTDGWQVKPTEIVPLVAVRGATASPVVFSAGTQLVLLVDVTGSHTSYRVTIRADRPGASPFWTQDDMRPTYLESLAVSMPGDLLEAGPYALTVEGVSTSPDGEKTYEHIQDISFESAPAE
ncbi:MAG: hypothetical protein JRE57_04730 [Deltaproteobacteria bacterium]|nr:hypothetical protein [Deltaproteobacteria bacterium]